MEGHPSTTELLNRVLGLEELAGDLQRRVRDLEENQRTLDVASAPQTVQERNRRLEESGVTTPGAASPGHPSMTGQDVRQQPGSPDTLGRREVLGKPHSEQ